MTSIDMGSEATDRLSSIVSGSTYIDMGNPANESGTITSVELWFTFNAETVKVATFSKSGTTFTPRAVATIGAVAKAAKRTFAVSLAVASGDYIGIYFSSGQLDRSTSGGSGVYYKSGDNTGAAGSYALEDGHAISVYATGSTATVWAGTFIGLTSPEKNIGLAGADTNNVCGV
jgi:hypothetical protein